MRALVRSPFVHALAGGAVVAVALLTLGVGGRGSRTTTVLEQARISGATTTDGVGPELTPHAIFERDAPGVVFVRARPVAVAADSPFGEREPQRGASGTGFVLDADGHILANHHVVGDATTVQVEFSDTRTVTATVLGEDPTNDLALLRVDPAAAELRPLTLGDSATARVGDPVVAIGHPAGVDRTLATGVVSALQRQLISPNGFTIQNVIQTDVPVNAGSSGGPLIDASGRVIGITAQIAGAAGDNAGVGFAVPIDTATKLLPELKRTGSVSHPYLGITVTTIDASLDGVQPQLHHGVLVQTVFKRSPAARAGVRGGTVESKVGGNRIQLGGDVITSLDGRTLTTAEELTAALARHRPGDRIRLGILRGGEALQLEVTLARAPKEAPSQTPRP